MAIVKRILNTSDGNPLVIVRQDELLSVEGDVRKLVALYAHVKKRLFDEFGVELDAAWEARVVGGEHDVPLPSIDTEYRKMERALRNVNMVARRLLNAERKMVTSIAVEDLGHIIRFCKEGGVTGNILRDSPELVSTAAAALVNRGSAPSQHAYTTHVTYVGVGCALCGRPEGEHATI